MLLGHLQKKIENIFFPQKMLWLKVFSQCFGWRIMEIEEGKAVWWEGECEELFCAPSQPNANAFFCPVRTLSFENNFES